MANGNDNWVPIVFSGPSGAGKSTLITRLMDEYKGRFAFGVSRMHLIFLHCKFTSPGLVDTTRKPRAGEVAGTHYHYVSREEFEDGLSSGEFIEHTQFSGNYYGTSKRAIEDVRNSGRLCLLDIDAQGVISMKELGLSAFYIFIQPPTLEDLEKRLRGRGSENDDSLKKRIESAATAMKLASTQGVYDIVITNDDFEKAYSELRKAITARFAMK